MDPENLLLAMRIAERNDAFRRSLFAGKTPATPEGQVVVTQGVSVEGTLFMWLASRAVGLQTTFTEADDPHGDHSFGAVTVNGKKVWWKIDLYDRAYEFGTPDPLDEDETRRVLTILFPSEY